MLPDRVSNPGPLTYESGALPIALRGPAPDMNLEIFYTFSTIIICPFLTVCIFPQTTCLHKLTAIY